ncbi:hypothetical protein ACFWVC_31030 [Streptomyces sp. NPDC058691]|uniref:hypothetical protein n=1 Tax=Streptomyces sp. NPDC058691 TaxID=3346601 RepID=UPI00364B3254
MSTATLGLVTGMALGFAGYFGGFGAFLVVAVLGALGLVIGCFAQGDLVLGDFVHRRDGGHDEGSRRHDGDLPRPHGNPAHQTFRRPRNDSAPPRSRVL